MVGVEEIHYLEDYLRFQGRQVPSDVGQSTRRHHQMTASDRLQAN